jgi:excisionase family DNA binding protein
MNENTIAELESRIASLERKLGIAKPGFSEFSPEDFVTPKQAAEMAGIPLPTIYYHMQKGNLPSIRVFGRIRIAKRDISSLFTK